MAITKRDINVDIIRVMACMIVIGTHVDNLIPTVVDKSKTLWIILFGDGVSLFFIIMGFFLFKSSSFSKLLKRTVVEIIVPALIIAVLSRLLYPWLSNELSLRMCLKELSFDCKDFFQNILSWTPGGYRCEHLWYIFSYVQVILLFPLLYPFCKCNTKASWSYYIPIFCGIGLIINDIQVFWTLPIKITPYIMMGLPAIYALAGACIYEKREKIRGNKWIGLISIVACILLQICRWMLQLRLFERDISNNYYVYWNTGFGFWVSILVVVFILSIKIIIPPWLEAIISFLSVRTFEIYLVHYAIILFLDTRGFAFKLLNVFGVTVETLGNLNALQEICYLGIRVIAVFVISLIIGNGLHCSKNYIKRFVSKLQRGGLHYV